VVISSAGETGSPRKVAPIEPVRAWLGARTVLVRFDREPRTLAVDGWS